MRPRNLKSESKLRARKKIAEYQLLLQQQQEQVRVSNSQEVDLGFQCGTISSKSR